MKKALLLAIVISTLTTRGLGQADAVFSKGEISTTDNHTGTIWLNELSKPDSILNYSIAVATYDAGAKLDWHMHPGGQVLLITEGTGYYQERGKPVQLVHKGDVIKCLPGVEHWHGASPTTAMTHIAIQESLDGKVVEWMEKVSDEQYKK